MKSKLGLEMEQFAELRESGKRESPAPRIVVCPPAAEEPRGERHARASRILRALGRRIRRRVDDDESASSSGDSASSDAARRDLDTSSEDSSEASSGRRRRSSVSLRRVFQTLSIAPRSSSAVREHERARKKNPQPRRILRPPVTYMYVRGPSGLPTQRVPRVPHSGRRHDSDDYKTA